MDLSQMRTVVSGIKFLDWKFEVEEGMYPEQIRLRLKDVVADTTTQSREPVPILTEVSMRRPDNIEMLINMMWELIQNRLRHEAGELFLVNGKLPFNEHNEKTAQEIIRSIYPPEAFEDQQAIKDHHSAWFDQRVTM